VNAIAYIQKLLELKDSYDRLLKETFGNERCMWQLLSRDFEHFLHVSQRSPEYLSLFIDDKLKNGLTDGEAEKSIILFRLLHEKEVFGEYYR